MSIANRSRATLAALAALALATPAFAASARHAAHHEGSPHHRLMHPGYGFDSRPGFQPGSAGPQWGDSSVCTGSFGRRIPCEVPGG